MTHGEPRARVSTIVYLATLVGLSLFLLNIFARPVERVRSGMNGYYRIAFLDMVHGRRTSRSSTGRFFPPPFESSPRSRRSACARDSTKRWGGRPGSRSTGSGGSGRSLRVLRRRAADGGIVRRVGTARGQVRAGHLPRPRHALARHAARRRRTARAPAVLSLHLVSVRPAPAPPVHRRALLPGDLEAHRVRRRVRALLPEQGNRDPARAAVRLGGGPGRTTRFGKPGAFRWRSCSSTWASRRRSR